MNTTDLSKLADVLRRNGADVFSGSSKFTLSLDLLLELNNSFRLLIDQRDAMNSSFHVVTSSSERVEEFRDLHFLHDFIQRSTSLKITPPFGAHRSGNIAHFKNLKLLEVHNVNIDWIQGIGAVRSHLQSLICTRSVEGIKSVLVNCGGDNLDSEQEVKWEDLKEAIFPHNHLAAIDGLHLMPNLHTLDLSHNDIEEADALDMLANLKNLNLSYNKLIRLPKFTGTSCNRIQILVISYNFIEDLMPISSLTNLRELDVSENCIVEHKALAPISNFATLQLLNLRGNPLSYHPQHRSKSTCYLHESTATVRFLLDGERLSKSEKQLTGSLHPRMRIRTDSNKSASSIPVEKPRRVRNVTITDNAYTPIIDNDTSEEFSSSMPNPGEHLDAKRQIEQLKKDYGEHWLKSQAGSLVQDVLGIEKSPLSSTPLDSPTEFALTEELSTNESELPTAEVNRSLVPYVSADSTLQDTLISNEASELYSTVQASDVRALTPSDEDPDDGDLGDGEENIFLATLVDTEESVFIVITDTHILERESTRSKELSRWPIETLTICESDENSITIYFDTMRKDAKSRKYEWDNDESPKLLAALRMIISNKPLQQAKLNVYKCLKCSTQFGVEMVKTITDDANGKICPTCGSNLVFEDD